MGVKLEEVVIDGLQPQRLWANASGTAAGRDFALLVDVQDAIPWLQTL